MSAIAIIPARGGSKRIPRKNIRDFCGKPMIAWSIEAAKVSGCFERIIVSTDDKEIAEISKQWGAEVPFMRPAELADAWATTGAVMAHAVGALASGERAGGFACCIYATAPLLVASDLQAGLKQIATRDLDYAISVGHFSYPIQRALKRSVSGDVAMADPAQVLTRSQDLEPMYHDAGQFYWGRMEAWAEQRSIFAGRTGSVIIPRERLQDIDEEADWAFAEQLKQLQESRRGG